MNALALCACVAVMTVLGLVLWCLDLRDEAAATQAARPCLPRAVTVVCPFCGRPVRYQLHPQGRRDAVRLHAAFECEAQLAIRRTR